MKSFIKTIVSCCLLAGCAQQHVLDNEAAVMKDHKVTAASDLKSLAVHGSKLSLAYRDAALTASNEQDALAFVTYLAAASFVHGAVGSASDTTLAKRAIVGAGSSSVAARTVSKTTISGIYSASKRMNCIATAAQMGSFLLQNVNNATDGMARAATYGAIEEVKITTRLALVKEVADFKTIRDDLIDGRTLSDEQKQGLTALRDSEAADLVLLNQYLGILHKCVGDVDNATAVGPVNDND